MPAPRLRPAPRVLAFLLAAALVGAVIGVAVRSGGSGSSGKGTSPTTESGAKGAPTDPAALWVFGFDTVRLSASKPSQGASMGFQAFGSVLGADGIVHMYEAADGRIGEIDARRNKLAMTGSVAVHHWDTTGVAPVQALLGHTIWLVTGAGELTPFDRRSETAGDVVTLPTTVGGLSGRPGRTRVVALGDRVLAVYSLGSGVAVARVDPRSGAVTRAVAAPEGLTGPSHDVRAVAGGAGAVWILGPSTVVGIDPATLSVSHRFSVDAGGDGLRFAAVAGGSVWSLGDNATDLVRIEVATGKVTTPVRMRPSAPKFREPASLVAGRGAVFVMVEASDEASDHSVRCARVDPRTARVTAAFGFSSGLFAGALAVS